MLGNHQLLERRLRKHGIPAMVDVLAAEDSGVSNVGGAGARLLCKMTVRIEPEGEPAFDARIDAWLVHPPKAGDVVPVLYHPADHGKVVIDHRDAALNEARIQSRTAPSIPRGRDPTQATALEGRRLPARADPEAFRKRTRAQGDAPEDPLDRLAKL